MRERALRFGETAELVGVVTEPAPDAGEGLPAVILLNAGILHRVGPSRMNVRIARRLATDGFASLRFDFSGIGDSEPRPDRLAFDESSVQEIREAMDHLERTRGTEEFVLVGLCSGADAALQGSLADERVVGLVPIDGHAYRTWRYYLHRYLPRLLRAESWKNLLTGETYMGPWLRRLLGRQENGGGADRERDEGGGVFQRPRPPREEVEKTLRTLAGRRVRMLHVFSGGMGERYNYTSQFHDTYRSVDFRGLARVEYFETADHTFTDLEQLDDLVATVADWAREGWVAGTRSASDEAASVEEGRGDRAA